MERKRAGNWNGLAYERNVCGKDVGWQLEMVRIMFRCGKYGCR